MPEPTRDPQAGTPGAPKLVPACTYISPSNIRMNEHPPFIRTWRRIKRSPGA